MATRPIAMAIDLKSLSYLRAHRRSLCHNTDRGHILSWNPPSSLHTPTALDKAYDDHAPWHSDLSPYPKYSLFGFIVAKPMRSPTPWVYPFGLSAFCYDIEIPFNVSVELCIQGMHWKLCYILQEIKSKTFGEIATRAHGIEMSFNCKEDEYLVDINDDDGDDDDDATP
ncbi:UNVERIFIED_CONTAM: hypothetical protein Scaly_2766100 [Sesamum calycinum]|uniref:Uncharacterized protein n=1 Tax=Sesamum calycinum TaxID=2727403 RepID=A0AAW2J0U4_9LAMI